MIKFAEGKKMAEVSIVIPNYNGMKYIEDCLQAVYAQRVEQGTHQQLLQKKGAYYQLYTLQFSKQQLEEK